MQIKNNFPFHGTAQDAVDVENIDSDANRTDTTNSVPCGSPLQPPCGGWPGGRPQGLYKRLPNRFNFDKNTGREEDLYTGQEHVDMKRQIEIWESKKIPWTDGQGRVHEMPYRNASQRWLSDGTGMPDAILFGGVYDDGCTSQEVWFWNARMGKWGWYNQDGEFIEGPTPDALCEKRPELESKLSANSMLNKMLFTRLSPWKIYQRRRLGTSNFDDVLKAMPAGTDICPPASRIGASAHRWGTRFLLFGGAQWRKKYPRRVDGREGPSAEDREGADGSLGDDGQNMHEVWGPKKREWTCGGDPDCTENWEGTQPPFEVPDPGSRDAQEPGTGTMVPGKLYDVLKQERLAEKEPPDADNTAYTVARSHGRRAESLFNDVWVLEERRSPGAHTLTNWFWILLSPLKGPLPMGRYEPATMLVEERSALYVFGGRSFNRSFNDLWQFDLLERTWRELTPEKGDRPLPRHGATITSMARAGSANVATLVMAFGRDLDPGGGDPTLYREVWIFGAVEGWRKLDYDAMCGCVKQGWDPESQQMLRTCSEGPSRCPQGRWGHNAVIPPVNEAGESAYIAFVGGWGENGRYIRSTLKMYFENPPPSGDKTRKMGCADQTHCNAAQRRTPRADDKQVFNVKCEVNCFEEVAQIEGTHEKGNTYIPSYSPCEMCEEADSCFSMPGSAQAGPYGKSPGKFSAPRVHPEWACGDENHVVETIAAKKHCAASHVPVICPISGRNVQTSGDEKFATGGYSHFRKPPVSERQKHEALKVYTDGHDEVWSNEASPNNPCRPGSVDAELEDLRAMDMSESWDNNGEMTIVSYSCSRVLGPLTLRQKDLGLNGFTARPGLGHCFPWNENCLTGPVNGGDLRLVRRQKPGDPNTPVVGNAPLTAAPDPKDPDANLDKKLLPPWKRIVHVLAQAYKFEGAGDPDVNGIYVRAVRRPVAGEKDTYGPVMYEQRRPSVLWDCDAGAACGMCLMALPPPIGPYYSQECPRTKLVQKCSGRGVPMNATCMGDGACGTRTSHVSAREKKLGVRKVPNCRNNEIYRRISIEQFAAQRELEGRKLPEFRSKELSATKPMAYMVRVRGVWQIRQGRGYEMRILYKQKRGVRERPPGGSDAWETIAGVAPGPIVWDEDEVTLRKDLNRDGTSYGGEALPFLWQHCPSWGQTVYGVGEDFLGMYRKCYNMTLGQCREACQNYGEWGDGSMCCDANAPLGSTDFFGYSCKKPNPRGEERRCDYCTGFAYDEKDGGCSLTHSDWQLDQFVPRQLAYISTSTFYVRERVLGHPRQVLPALTCPMLSSGFEYTEVELARCKGFPLEPVGPPATYAPSPPPRW